MKPLTRRYAVSGSLIGAVVASLLLNALPVRAQPQSNPVAHDSAEGTVVDRQTGKALEGAWIYRTLNAEVTGFARTAKDGTFRLAPSTTAPSTDSSELLALETGGHAPALLRLPLAGLRNLRVQLGAGHTLRAHVTTMDGKPVASARLVVQRIYLNPDEEGNDGSNFYGWPFWSPLDLQKGTLTDAQGNADLVNVPDGGVAKLEISKARYATTHNDFHLVHNVVYEARLALTTAIHGTLFLDGPTPAENLPFKNSEGFTIKIQEPWQSVGLAPDGTYSLDDVSAADGKSRYFNINLEGAGIGEKAIAVGPDITAEYTHSGYDIVFAQTSARPELRWIGYVEILRGLKEGEDLQRDIHLIPMAHLHGTVTDAPATVAGLGARPTAAQHLSKIVWYDDVRTLYGPMINSCDIDGHFDLWVPITATRLYFGPSMPKATGIVPLTPLKAFERREVPITWEQVSGPEVTINLPRRVHEDTPGE